MREIDHIVVDIGNSACKIGLVRAEELLQTLIVGLDECDDQPWRHTVVNELTGRRPRWTLSGSNPPVVKNFGEWLNRENQSHRVIDASTPLPIRINVDYPDRVGRDRLLNALAIEKPLAIIISAGSAVTVDLIDQQSTFQGGAIFPGVRLMAKSLHEHTAQLPFIDTTVPLSVLPGKNTEQAMLAGIVHAVRGGILGCVNEMIQSLDTHIQKEVTIYLTGGDAATVQHLLPWPLVVVPSLTLHGIIVASRTLWS